MEKLLKIPYAVFNDWDLLQQFLKRKGNPRYELIGDVDLRWREDIIDLGNLIRVDGILDLYSSAIESLGKLQYVGSNLNLTDSSIESLGSLEYVGGHLVLPYTSIKELGNLKYVGHTLNLSSSLIQSLGNLEYVGEEIWLSRYHQIPLEQLTKFKFKYM